MNKNTFFLFLISNSCLLSMEDKISSCQNLYTIITIDGARDEIPQRHLLLSKVISDMTKDFPDNRDAIYLPINSDMLSILKNCLTYTFILHATKSCPESRDKRTTTKNELYELLSSQKNLHTILTFADQQDIPGLLKYCMKLWAKKKYASSAKLPLPFDLDKSIAKYMKGSKNLLDYTATWVTQNSQEPLEKTLINSPNKKISWSAAIDNKGTLIAINQINNIAIYDRETHETEYIKTDNNDRFINLQFNSDNQLWSSGINNTIQLWDLATKNEVNIFQSPECRAVVFRHIPQHNILIADGRNYTLYCWNLEYNNNNPTIINAHNDSITTIESTSNGSLFASGSHDCSVHVWKTSTREKIFSFKHDKGIESICFNNAQDTLACGLKNGRLVLYDLITTKEVGNRKEPLNDITQNIASIIFDKNDILLCSVLGDRTIKLWDVRTYKTIKTLFSHYGFMECMTDNQNNLISVSYNGIILTWDLRKLVQPIKNLRNEILDKCTIEHILKVTGNTTESLNIDDPLFTNFSNNTKKFFADSTYRKK